MLSTLSIPGLGGECAAQNLARNAGGTYAAITVDHFTVVRKHCVTWALVVTSMQCCIVKAGTFV